MKKSGRYDTSSLIEDRIALARLQHDYRKEKIGVLPSCAIWFRPKLRADDADFQGFDFFDFGDRRAGADFLEMGCPINASGNLISRRWMPSIAEEEATALISAVLYWAGSFRWQLVSIKGLFFMALLYCMWCNKSSLFNSENIVCRTAIAFKVDFAYENHNPMGGDHPR
jgi:hypothetical protein